MADLFSPHTKRLRVWGSGEEIKFFYGQLERIRLDELRDTVNAEFINYDWLFEEAVPVSLDALRADRLGREYPAVVMTSFYPKSNSVRALAVINLKTKRFSCDPMPAMAKRGRAGCFIFLAALLFFWSLSFIIERFTRPAQFIHDYAWTFFLLGPIAGVGGILKFLMRPERYVKEIEAVCEDLTSGEIFEHLRLEHELRRKRWLENRSASMDD